MEERSLTGAEAGLVGDEQIKIALQTMIKNGGTASMEEIYRAVEAQMSGYILSQQGKASLRSFINKTAVNKEFVSHLSGENKAWNITPKGRNYIINMEESEDVEEELLNDEKDDVSVYEPYDPSHTKVDLMPFTVFQVMRKIKLKEIDMQPDFQRHIVWDETRQSRLIESILIRIPLPAFYLDAVNEDK